MTDTTTQDEPQPDGSGAPLDPEVWLRAQEDLASGLTSQQRALMPQLASLAVVDNTVFLQAPNAFTRNEAERLLRGPLTGTLSNRLGRSVKVVFVGTGTVTPAAPIEGAFQHSLSDALPDSQEQQSGSAVRVGDIPSQPAAGETPDDTSQTSLTDPSPEPPPHDEAATHGTPPRQEAPSRPGSAPGSDPTAGSGTEAAESDDTVAGPGPGLNAKYTFDSFVIGPSNRFAHAAAFAVAEGPARSYNPLFIYGDSGLGKTHLLHAVGEYAHRLFPGIRVRYVSTEEFTNDFINSVRDGTAEGFRRRYRDVDVLLIDDIQFIENREGTQEEFFHTFNTLHTNSKQLVITSDRPPKQLVTLEDRLRTRFEWGLITDVTPPDLETRIAILRKKAAQERIAASDDVLEAIASRVQSNIRELEGALIRVAAFASLDQRPIDVEVADGVLGDIVPGDETPQITVERIIGLTSEHFGVTVEDLCGPSRNRNLTNARQIAMYLCREMTDLSLPRIGQAFGGRDHSTVIHANKKIGGLMQEKRQIYDQVTRLTKKIQGKDH